MDTLLLNQFVAEGHFMKRVAHGAGMGLNFAGELSDLVLCLLAEKSKHRFFRNPALVFFGRFKDDIIAIFRDQPEIWRHGCTGTS